MEHPVNMVIIAVAVAAVIVGGAFGTYQLYRLVELDAVCRGLKHPKLWGVLSAAGNNSSWLLLYLVRRRKYPVQSMTEEQKRLMERRKRSFGVGLIFIVLGAIACVWSAVLMGEV